MQDLGTGHKDYGNWIPGNKYEDRHQGKLWWELASFPWAGKTWSQRMHTTSTIESKGNQIWQPQRNIEMSAELLNSKTEIKPTEKPELSGSFYPLLKINWLYLGALLAWIKFENCWTPWVLKISKTSGSTLLTLQAQNLHKYNTNKGLEKPLRSCIPLNLYK